MLLADEMGLGKTASVICFIQCLRYALMFGMQQYAIIIALRSNLLLQQR